MQPSGPHAEMQKLIEEIVKRPISDPTLNFFEAKIVDSLSAVKLLVELEKRLDITINVFDFATRESFTLPRLSHLLMNGAAQA